MKNLANCGPREFMRQTAKIRHAVEKWLKLTDVLNIRDKLPKIADDLPADERDKAFTERGKHVISMALDAIMDEHRKKVNEQLAAYERLSAIIIHPTEFEKTPKRSIKRFLYQ